MRTWLRWVACAALLLIGVALALSFRGGDRPAEAQSQPSATAETAAPEPVVTPTPAEPARAVARTAEPGTGSALPGEARGLTISAAEAFSRYYIDQTLNQLKKTGDASGVRRLSLPACASCQRRIAFFTTHNGRNKRLTGDYLWRDTDIRQVRLTGPRMAVVDVNTRTGRHAATQKAGRAPTQYAGGTTHFVITLVARATNWAVLEMELR